MLKGLDPAMIRCPLCAAWGHARYATHLRCKLCSLAFCKDSGDLPPLDSYREKNAEFHFPNWNNWLSRATRHKVGRSASDFKFAPSTVRMFAARQGRRITSLKSSLPLTPFSAPWSFGRTIHATIQEKAQTGPDNRLTLGIIAAIDAWESVLALCIGMADHAADAIVLLDTPDTETATALEAQVRGILSATSGMQPRVIAHPLNGDFAAQRNRIQAAVRTEWVLQLDADEELTIRTKQLLPDIIDDAERSGWDAVGFARRNFVDGTLSALYPDVQYRLLRRSIHFTRAVHEHPRLDSHHVQFTHLGAEIIHTIASSRLDVREAMYKGIEAGADRPYDTALLRKPLETSVRLPA